MPHRNLGWTARRTGQTSSSGLYKGIFTYKEELLARPFSIFQFPKIHPIFHQTLAQTIFVKCAWEYADLPRTFKTIVYGNFGGVNRLNYGKLAIEEWDKEKRIPTHALPDAGWAL